MDQNNDDSYRVIRGGSWNERARDARVAVARVAIRYSNIPSDRNDFLGFRLSRLIDPLKQISEVLDEQR